MVGDVDRALLERAVTVVGLGESTRHRDGFLAQETHITVSTSAEEHRVSEAVTHPLSAGTGDCLRDGPAESSIVRGAAAPRAGGQSTSSSVHQSRASSALRSPRSWCTQDAGSARSSSCAATTFLAGSNIAHRVSILHLKLSTASYAIRRIRY